MGYFISDILNVIWLSLNKITMWYKIPKICYLIFARSNVVVKWPVYLTRCEQFLTFLQCPRTVMEYIVFNQIIVREIAH